MYSKEYTYKYLLAWVVLLILFVFTEIKVTLFTPMLAMVLLYIAATDWYANPQRYDAVIVENRKRIIDVSNIAYIATVTILVLL